MTDSEQRAALAARTAGPDCDVDETRHGVRDRQGRWLFMSANQWAAFSYLYRYRGRQVSAEEIASAVWRAHQPDSPGASRRQLIYSLRLTLRCTRFDIVTWRLGDVHWELVTRETAHDHRPAAAPAA